MALYRVDLHGGQMGIVEARSARSALKEARHDEGHYNVRSVRHASEEDIEWAQAFGARLPPIPAGTRDSPAGKVAGA